MSSITEEMQQLQLRILELEKLQKEKDESDKDVELDNNEASEAVKEDTTEE